MHHKTTAGIVQKWGDSPAELKRLAYQLQWAEGMAASASDPELRARWEALVSQLRADQSALLRLVTCVEGLMADLSDLQRRILQLRYRDKLTYVAMSHKICYSVDYIKQQRARAIAALARYVEVEGTDEAAIGMAPLSD